MAVVERFSEVEKADLVACLDLGIASAARGATSHGEASPIGKAFAARKEALTALRSKLVLKD